MESPKQDEPKRPIVRHNIIKMAKLKDKEKVLKVEREKQLVTYKGAPIRLSSDFSTKIFHARRYCYEIFKVRKSEHLQPRPHPASLSKQSKKK